MQRAHLQVDPADRAGEANRLAETHLGLVDPIVAQLAARFPRHVDRDELRGAGIAGLVEAAHRYDPDSGVPFPHFAAIRIRGSILDLTRSRDWATRRLRRDLRAIEEATDALEARLARHPDDAEVAAALGFDEQVVRERRAAALTSSLLALDHAVHQDGTTPRTLADQIAETDDTWLPEAAAQHNELVGTLRAAIGRLPEQLGQVLVQHHFEGRLLREIADDLGVTEARVSQLGQEALHALQAYFAVEFGTAADVPETAAGKRRRASFVSTMRTDTSWRSRFEAAHLPVGIGA